jgi:hypothetical protein
VSGPRRTGLASIVATVLACATLLGVAPGQAEHAGALAPREKRVMLVTDSVGLGTRGVLEGYFPADWDVSIVGKPAVFVRDLPGGYIQPNLYRAGDHVVIAAGYNYPFWDPDRFDRAIDATITTLRQAGVENIYWVTLREVKPQYITASAWRQVQKYYWYFPTVNDHLERALARHPGLTLIDWAAVADRPGITYDAIHLNRTGAELYSSLIARAVADARTRPKDETVTRIKVAGAAAVAAGDVTAVAVNLTSVRGRTRGYLSAFPCAQGSSPTSNLNHQRDQVVAAAAIVPVDSNGEICVFNKQAGHIIVDVFGRFNATAELTNTGSTRLTDTRRSGGGAPHPAGVALRVDVGTPERTVALNVTVTQAAARGYLTVHDCASAPPDTSNVNFVAQLAAPNLVVARADATGHVCVTTTQNAHVIVDLLAEFGDATTVAATTPVRLADTRGGALPSAGEVVRIETPIGDDPEAPVSGIVGNLTITRPQGSGFATVYPCAGGQPDTSNINFRAGQTIANAVIVEPDASGMICVFTNVAAEVVFDLLATTGTGFTGVAPNRPLDTRHR